MVNYIATAFAASAGGTHPRFGSVQPANLLQGIVDRAQEICRAGHEQRDIAAIQAESQALRSHLETLRNAVPPARPAAAQDLRTIQAAINALKRALDGHSALGHDASASSRTSAARTFSNAAEEIDRTQRALEGVIANTVHEARLQGNALKDFMKTAYPAPDTLITHALRVLSPAQVREVAATSKGLRHFAGVASKRDRGRLYLGGLRNVSRASPFGKERPVASAEQQVKALTFMAANVEDERQRELARSKLYSLVSQPDYTGHAAAVMTRALSSIEYRYYDWIDGNSTLREPDAFRLDAFNSSRLVSAKADRREQQDAIGAFRRIHARHMQNKITLTIPQRYAISQALATISMAQLELGAEFRSLFALFVDEEVRQFSNGRLGRIRAGSTPPLS